MGRFLANVVKSIDKKGRVCVPASFRAALDGQGMLHTMLSISNDCVDAGGPQLIDAAENRLAQMDPFSEEYEVWSFCIHGDSDQLKIDGDGRIVLSEAICEHAKISDSVAFVGRGHFFQIWQPELFKAYQNETRAKALELRKQLGKSGISTTQAPQVAGGRK